MARSQVKDRAPGALEHDHCAAMHGCFGWRVPARFNMAQVRCAGWAGRVSPQAAFELIALPQVHVRGRLALCAYPKEI